MRLTRGCGHRKIGGLYLAGEGMGKSCSKFPAEIPQCCPTCGHGVKQSRGLTFVSPELLEFQRGHCGSEHCAQCPIGVLLPDRVGLMWVGNAHYLPADFVSEAMKYGVSKRISQVPRELVLGKTWIMLAHPEAVVKLVQPNEC